ncbi:MAG: hypothetical protein HY698_11940 [Deltaproteobacteria bacterium]|nr:hypothetical protein [Deltaproteobacteria bacterium]
MRSRAAWMAFLLLAPARVYAEEAESEAMASACLTRGLSHYEARDYEAAIDEFRRGHAFVPRLDLLFAWAQAERLSGDCPSAVVLYRKFIESNPPAKQAEAAQKNMARCEAALATRPEELPDALRPSAVSAPPPEPTPEPTARPASEPLPKEAHGRSVDKVGIGLLATGLAGMGTGLVFLVTSSKEATHAQERDRYDEYEGGFERARQRRLVAITALALGTALVAGGTWHLALSEQRALAAVPLATAKGVGIALGGTF